MKKAIVTVVSLFLMVLLFACSSTTDAGTEEHVAKFVKTDIIFSDGYAEHELYINTETKCMYTVRKWFIPIAEQDWGSSISGNCIGPYQDLYEEMSK